MAKLQKFKGIVFKSLRVFTRDFFLEVLFMKFSDWHKTLCFIMAQVCNWYIYTCGIILSKSA